MPLEAIRGTQVRAHNVGLAVAPSQADPPALAAVDDLAVMTVENEARVDVAIEAYPFAWGVGRRVVRPKSV